MPDDTALLWCLRGHGRDVRCLRRRTPSSFELRILWGDELFLTESFHDPVRLGKRADEFRSTLQTRGWSAIQEDAPPPTPPSRAAERDGVPAARERSRDDAEAGAPLQRRVLIVDDEVTVRTFLRRYLQEAGYTVTEASDVDGALNALDQQPIDALVLDVRLPDPMGWGRTGLEVLAFIRLHKAFSPLPVIVLTGQSLEPEEQELIRRHRADLFLKPDGYLMMLKRLDHLMGGHRASG